MRQDSLKVFLEFGRLEPAIGIAVGDAEHGFQQGRHGGRGGNRLISTFR